MVLVGKFSATREIELGGGIHSKGAPLLKRDFPYKRGAGYPETSTSHGSGSRTVGIVRRGVEVHIDAQVSKTLSVGNPHAVGIRGRAVYTGKGSDPNDRFSLVENWPNDLAA